MTGMSKMQAQSYDVIVLGVGGMGSATCAHLSGRGLKILGLEQFEIGHALGSSHGETRAIRRAYFEHPDYIPLLNRSYELWDKLVERSGEPLLTRNGMVIYGNPGSSSVYQGTIQSAALYQIPIERWTSDEALKRFPMYAADSEMGAVFEPGAGFLQVEKAVMTHARLAKDQGAVIRTGVQVLNYTATPSHVVVQTNQGEFVADRLVITAGAWSGKLLQDLQVPLKLKNVFQCWFEASSAHDVRHGVPCFAFHLKDDFYYGFPMLDGRSIKIAAHGSGDPMMEPADRRAQAPSLEKLETLQAFVRKYLPEVKPNLIRTAGCLYTLTPDENFIIDIHPEHSNVCFAAGFSGHGFKFAPVIGEILADFASEGTTSLPMDFLRLRKF